MSSDLPVRLPPSQLRPPETYLRPGVAWRFWLLTGGITLSLALSTLMLLAGAIPGLVYFTLFALALGYRMSHQNRWANRENQRGVNLLNAGEVAEAGRLFEALAQRRTGSYAHVVFTYNCAVAAMLDGRHQRALSIFNAVEASRKLRSYRLRALLPNLYTEMGCCLALTGEILDARAQLRRAKELVTPDDGRMLFLEAVVAIRSGDIEGAVRRIDQQWRSAEGALRAPTVRTLRVIYAFALAQLGQRDTELYRNLIAGALPSVQRDFHWATVSWPEFDEFVRATIPA